MTPLEHCPRCLAAARRAQQHQDGEQTITTWRCTSCAHTWQTSYLTAAYGHPDDDPASYSDEPIDDPEARPGYWDQYDTTFDPRTGW